jgi:Ni/Co efflux regulator RcnB
MKRILLTLLIMAGSFIAASAQNRPQRQRAISERKRDRMELHRLHRMEHRHHRRRHHRMATLSTFNGQYQLSLNLFKPEEKTAG